MRHSFLKKMMLTKDAEDLSYENSIKVLTTATLGILGFCILEVASYFTYLIKVRRKDELQTQYEISWAVCLVSSLG